MSVRFYDEAITNRIKAWIKDPHLTLLKPEETSRLFQMRADQKDDKPLTLPLIAISREPEIEILNTQRQPKSYDGMKIKAYDDKGKEIRFDSTFKLSAIPIKIGYQIDIYTRNLEEADEYAREFTFRLINKPAIEVTIPYNNVKLVHQSSIQQKNIIRDNSDIPERHFVTQFTKFTIEITIDDAYYFSVEDKRNLAVEGFEVAVLTRDPSDNSVIDEEIVYTNVK